SIPYNTSTCIDAKTIPLVSKYSIKSHDKGSILKTNGISAQVSGVRAAHIFSEPEIYTESLASY
ncbi:MAG: hypothetical protein PVH43_12050, partial [Desulfobacterales bacterium]